MRMKFLQASLLIKIKLKGMIKAIAIFWHGLKIQIDDYIIILESSSKIKSM